MPYRLDLKIDRIVADSDGSLHDALRALLQVNEQLEAELARLRAAVMSDAGPAGRSLH